MAVENETQTQEDSETAKETKEEPRDESESESEDSEAEGEDEEEKAEAIKLYQALKGPNAERIIRILAEEAGISTTKAEKKETKNIILESFEEALGEQYKFLAPKLGQAIDKILNDHTQKIDAKFNGLKQEEIKRDSDTAVDEMLKEHDDFEKVYPRVLKLMDEIRPTDKLSPKAYLKRLYTLAKQELSDKDRTASKSDKLKKSQNDVPSRLREASVGGDDSKFKSEERPKSRRQAITEALEELEAK